MTTENPKGNENQQQQQPNQQMNYVPYEPEEGLGIPGGGSSGGKSGGFMQSDIAKVLIVCAITSLVVVFVMNSWIMPLVGKKAYEADITRLELDLVAMRETDTGITAKVTKLEDNSNKVVADLQAASKNAVDSVNTKLSEVDSVITSKLNGLDYATSKELESAVSGINTKINNISNATDSQARTDISTLKTETANLKTENTNLKTQLSSLATTIAELEDEIEKLKVTNTTGDGTVVTGDIGVNVKYLGSEVLINSSDNKTLTGQFKVVVKNNTDKNLNDIILMLMVENQYPMPAANSVTLTSSPSLSWITSGYYYGTSEWHNSWGLSIDAGASKTLYFTFQLKSNDGEFKNTYGYRVSCEVDY